jgi:single-strand DNA-binding protein
MTNKITIVGRLAADIETKTAGDGTPMGNFTVASDIGYGAKKTTNWFRCTLYGKRVDSVAQFLNKGQQVTIFGSLTLREWTTKDGVKQLSPDVWVDDFALVGGKQDASAPAKQQQRAPQQGGTPDFAGDDIPFAPLPRRALTTI